MTTKKIIREVEYTVGDADDDYAIGEKRKTAVSRTERLFTYNQEQHGTLADFETACEGMAVQSISDIFDRKTVVLDDSDGNYFAVAGYAIVSATAKVIDSLDV